ncbi:MAG: helix-turn-helix transcriptional regulator [Paenibacillaceae bacterium]|nr:helix-turn-helix transcriptional regulator [Paenibacillaceae bacterium]
MSVDPGAERAREPFVQGEAVCPDPWMPELTLTGDFTMVAGAKVGPRTLDAYELVFFPGGSATTYTASGDTYALDRPCLTITRPGELHQCQFDPGQPVRHLFAVFYFPREEGRRWFESFLHGHIFIPVDARSPVPAMFRHILHLSDAQGPNWKLRCSVLLFALLEELREAAALIGAPQPETAIPHPLRMAVDYMERHLAEPVSMEELAHRIGWSHGYFARAFTRHFGEPPSRHLGRLRMERAARMLLYRTASVKEIAAELGFANEHYFSRLFKAIKGISATAYRERGADSRFRQIVLGNERDVPYATNHYFTYGHPMP